MASAARRRRGAARRACGPTRRTGWPRCGRGWVSTPTSAPSHTRSAGSASAVHLDKGCYRGQETVARVHNLGKPPRMLVLAAPGRLVGPAGHRRSRAGGRAAVGRLGTVVDHVDEGPIALALLKRGLPADTALTTGGEAQVAAVIDADSMPAADMTGAGRLAVERLRGGARETARACQRTAAGTVKCWQDNKHTQIGAACLVGPLRYCARGSPHGPRPGEGKADQGCS